jgi:hypothetical protein
MPYIGGVLMADGRVFCVPLNATSARIYDPANEYGEHGRRVPGIECIRRWGSHAGRPGVLRPVQRHVCVDLRSRDEFGEHGRRVPGIDAYYGGVLLPDGRVFCVPFNATSASIVDPNSTVTQPFTQSDAITLSPFLNKF